MRKALLVALSLPLVACVVGNESGGPGPGGDDGPGPGPGPGDDTGLSGSISSDTTWTGATRIKGAVTIETGVTVTVAPGATLTFANYAGIDIKGTLKMEGTKAERITLNPETGTSFGSLSVTGTLTMSYVVDNGGSINTMAGSTTTIADTKMWRASGDFFNPYGGKISITYSQIGGDVGETDTTHCNLHTRGPIEFSMTHSNIGGAPYGIMLYEGQNVILTQNNWYTNGVDVDTSGASAGVSGDVSGSWFDGAAPVAMAGVQLTKNGIAPAKLTDAGIR